MRIRSILPVFVAALVAVVFTADAMAMYHPELGRFVQRDPYGTVISPQTEGFEARKNRGFIPRSQYADGMNLYQYVGGKPVVYIDPQGLSKQIFAFEGLAGFYDPRDDAKPPVPGDFQGIVSGSLMKRYWNPLGNAVGTVHYYAQNDVSAAVSKAIELAKKPNATDEDGNCYDTIIVMGYSNGGRAAIQFAERLDRENIKVSVGITADPVPKGLELVPPLSFFPSVFLTRPSNVDFWVNYYQKTDRKTLGGLPVLGHPVSGANHNLRKRNLAFKEYGHITIMSDPGVLKGVRSLLENSDESQETWMAR